MSKAGYKKRELTQKGYQKEANKHKLNHLRPNPQDPPFHPIKLPDNLDSKLQKSFDKIWDHNAPPQKPRNIEFMGMGKMLSPNAQRRVKRIEEDKQPLTAAQMGVQRAITPSKYNFPKPKTPHNKNNQNATFIGASTSGYLVPPTEQSLQGSQKVQIINQQQRGNTYKNIIRTTQNNKRPTTTHKQTHNNNNNKKNTRNTNLGRGTGQDIYSFVLVANKSRNMNNLLPNLTNPGSQQKGKERGATPLRIGPGTQRGDLNHSVFSTSQKVPQGSGIRTTANKRMHSPAGGVRAEYIYRGGDPIPVPVPVAVPANQRKGYNPMYRNGMVASSTKALDHPGNKQIPNSGREEVVISSARNIMGNNKKKMNIKKEDGSPMCVERNIKDMGEEWRNLIPEESEKSVYPKYQKYTGEYYKRDNKRGEWKTPSALGIREGGVPPPKDFESKLFNLLKKGIMEGNRVNSPNMQRRDPGIPFPVDLGNEERISNSKKQLGGLAMVASKFQEKNITNREETKNLITTTTAIQPKGAGVKLPNQISEISEISEVSEVSELKEVSELPVPGHLEFAYTGNLPKTKAEFMAALNNGPKSITTAAAARYLHPQVMRPKLVINTQYDGKSSATELGILRDDDGSSSDTQSVCTCIENDCDQDYSMIFDSLNSMYY